MKKLDYDKTKILLIKRYDIKAKNNGQRIKHIFNRTIKREICTNKKVYYNKNKSNNNIKLNILNWNIFFIIIFVLLLFLILSKEIKINSISEITITIKGSQNQNILSSHDRMTVPIPNQILINGEVQNYREK